MRSNWLFLSLVQLAVLASLTFAQEKETTKTEEPVAAEAEKPTTAEKTAAQVSPAATFNAVTSLLQENWAARRENVLRVGSGILNKANQSRADMVLVNYAYGVLLLHHDHNEAAVTAFQKAAKASPDSDIAQVGIAVAQMRLGRTDAAMSALLKAAQAAQPTEQTIRVTAGILTYFTEVPAAKLKRGKIKEVELALFPRLSPEQQAIYRDSMAATRQYVASLPALREKMLEPVKALKDQMIVLETAYKQKQAERAQHLQAYQAMNQQIAQQQRLSANSSAAFDAQIAAAYNAGNNNQAAALQAQKSAMLSRFAFEIGQIQTQLNLAGQAILQTETAMKQQDATYRELETKVKAEEKRVDDALAVPPSPFDPLVQRDALLDLVRNQARERASQPSSK